MRVIPLDFIHAKEMRIDIYGKLLAHLDKKKTKNTMKDIIRYSLHPAVVYLLSIHHIGECIGLWSIYNRCVLLIIWLTCWLVLHECYNYCVTSTLLSTTARAHHHPL